MNPFDLTGPPFLMFFLVLSTIVLIGLHLYRKLNEDGDPPAFDTSDPYLIATLRGGGNEAARVATISLIERQILVASPEGKITVRKEAAQYARSQFEQAVLGYFLKSNDPAGLFADPGVKQASERYEDHLKHLGAFPSGEQKVKRALGALAAVAFLWLVGIVKIQLAISRGRSNYLFLILLMIVAAVVAIAMGFPRLTTLGSRMVRDLKSLFSRLAKTSKKSASHANANEAAMLAAVFGMAAMSALAYPYVRQVFPRASAAGGDSAGSSCGSSSSDSGGGSSCGGSSCGGGGGGCGGCGS